MPMRASHAQVEITPLYGARYVGERTILPFNRWLRKSETKGEGKVLSHGWESNWHVIPPVSH